VVCHDVSIGERVTIAPGAVIGSDGFGLAKDKGRWIKVPQLGSVRVGNDVDIGANTTIDRGALEDTILEEGVRLDNQIQVAHNVFIGAHTAIAGCVGISGSARIGRNCLIGGGAGIVGHLEITDNVVVTGMTMVTRSITRPGVYSSGVPAQDNDSWNRNYARFRQLDKLARKVQRLEQQLAASRDEVRGG
jgi:UDP-3-O-[3-hydroxymyristoyl] glucosamine N-acyltransferase